MPDCEALVFDIDRTLLTTEFVLSEANLNALRACARNGIALYVATARARRHTETTLGPAALFLTSQGAFCNGAVAIDDAYNFYKERLLTAAQVSAIVPLLEDAAPDAQIIVQIGNHLHGFRFPLSDDMLRVRGLGPGDVLPFAEASRRACARLVARHEQRSLDDVCNLVRDQLGDQLTTILADDGRSLHITTRGASKENGILDLIALRGIPPGRVVAFGDDAQDLGLFETFGRSVAMGNAIPELKERATFVTRSSEQDGVAFALREYLGLT